LNILKNIIIMKREKITLRFNKQNALIHLLNKIDAKSPLNKKKVMKLSRKSDLFFHTKGLFKETRIWNKLRRGYIMDFHYPFTYRALMRDYEYKERVYCVDFYQRGALD